MHPYNCLRSILAFNMLNSTPIVEPVGNWFPGNQEIFIDAGCPNGAENAIFDSFGDIDEIDDNSN